MFKAIKPRYYGSNNIKVISNKNFFIPSSIHKKKLKNKSPADNRGSNFFQNSVLKKNMGNESTPVSPNFAKRNFNTYNAPN